jgi:hypothetical protein
MWPCGGAAGLQVGDAGSARPKENRPADPTGTRSISGSRATSPLRGYVVKAVRNWSVVWLVAALWTIPLSARAGSVLVPAIDFSGEDTKINVPMSLIVDVVLEPGSYSEGPEPREVMRNYQQDRHGRYDDRILPRLEEQDLAAIYRYVLWLRSKPENQVGSASQSSGQALFVPEGVSLILRPNLAQYRGIEAVFGTLGGGPPYMPGVFVPGEGWSIPFSFKEIRPGTRAVMVIAIDHSNQKKARVLWFDLWSHSGEGRQFGPYEIHVTQAIDQYRHPFRVQSMDALDVALNYCKGLAPAVTMVGADKPQTQVIPNPPGGDPPPIQEHLAASPGPPPPLSPPEQDVTVRLWDERGNPFQQEIPVEIYSLDARGCASEITLPVLGPTTGRLRRSDHYGVVLTQAGFSLDPEPGDRTITLNGAPVVVRSGNENGAVQFDFRRQPVAARPLRRETVPRPSPLSPARALPAPSCFSRTREIMVRVSPSSLGSAQLPIVWTESGKPIRRSVLRPGYTTIVERFPQQSRVVPKAGSAGWRISLRQGLGWETQFVAIPQKGRP